MTTNENQHTSFIEFINEQQQIWGLQTPEGDWVVCDSAEFEATDVMPIWAEEKGAKTFCIEQWQDYTPAAIHLDEFIEEWIADLNDDGVLIGLNWQQDSENIEIDPIELAKIIVNV